MKFGLFGCCGTSKFLSQYELAIGVVLDRLDIDIIKVSDFTCCGYPFRNIDFKLYVLSSARNLALAEKSGLNIVTYCNCCYGTLKHVKHLLQENESLRQEINRTLNTEGLNFSGNTEVQHLVEVLYHNKERIEQKMVGGLDNIRVALHYGCHLLRPRQIVQSDGFAPVSACNQLVDLTGARRLDWKEMFQCCGASVVGFNDGLAMDFVEKKFQSVLESEAEILCVICPFCQIQFEKSAQKLAGRTSHNHQVPSILYVQMLGLCLGIEPHTLGLHQKLPLTERAPAA